MTSYLPSYRTTRNVLLLLAAIQYLQDVATVYQVITNYYDSEEVDPEEIRKEQEEIKKEYDNKNDVTKEDFENILKELDQELGDQDTGLFKGIDDPALPLLKELAAGFGGIRAVLLQISHPYIASGIVLHSNVGTNPYDRAEKTQRYTTGMFYGSRKEIWQAARAVRGLHSKVVGEIGEDVGIFNSNSPFSASQRDAIRWVAATMPDTVNFSFELLVRKLTLEEKDALVQLDKRFLKCFGVSSDKIPTTWKEYQRNYQAMLQSKDLIMPSEAAFTIIDTLSIPSYSWMQPITNMLKWFNDVQLPPRLRDVYYGRKLTKLDFLLWSLLVGRIRFVYRFIPEWLRSVTPYHNLRLRVGADNHWKVTRWLVQRIGELAHYMLVLLLVPRNKEDVDKVVQEKRLARKLKNIN